MDTLYGDSSPSFTAINICTAELWTMKTSIVLDYRRIKYRKKAEISRCQKKRVCRIVNNVNNFLTFDQKRV